MFAFSLCVVYQTKLIQLGTLQVLYRNIEMSKIYKISALCTASEHIVVCYDIVFERLKQISYRKFESNHLSYFCLQNL